MNTKIRRRKIKYGNRSYGKIRKIHLYEWVAEFCKFPSDKNQWHFNQGLKHGRKEFNGLSYIYGCISTIFFMIVCYLIFGRYM